MPLDELQTLEQYLDRFGPVLAARFNATYPPRFDPRTEAPHPAIAELLRRPYPAQAGAITALARVLAARRGAFLCGEIGVGKTLVAAALLHVLHHDGFRALVVCPSHLLPKWRRELEATVPDIQIHELRGLADCLALEALRERPQDGRHVWLVSRDRAKLSYAWRAAVLTRPGSDALHCPRCGAVQRSPQGEPLPLDFFEQTRRACARCREPLWQADPAGPRRVAPAEFIGRRLRGFFALVIADEVHEMKGHHTAQGHALGRLAAAARRTLVLTGTLAGGYASTVHALIGRVSPEALRAEGLGVPDLRAWIARYGTLETLRIQPETNGSRFSRGARERVLVRERPGISPRVFAEHLLERSAFVELRDLALDLPPLTEEAQLIEPDPALREACQALERDLRAGIRRALRGRHMLTLGRYLHTLLAFPDHPDGFGPLYDPEDPSRVLAVPPRLPLDHAYAKDRALIALVQAERAQGRRVLVYTTASRQPDAVGRTVRLLRAHGVWAEALRAELPPERRERWVAQQATRGVEGLVCHPALVGTGLDLIDWPTVAWMLPSWSVYMIRQASRRAYRVGQARPVRIVFFGYRRTLQARLLGLLGAKIEASLAIEGRFQAHGLLALADPGDLGTALARSLVDGLQGFDSAEAIWRRLSPPAAPPDPVTIIPPAMAPKRALLAAPAAAPVVVITREGGWRRRRRVRPDELGEAVGQLGFAWPLPDRPRA